MLEDVALDVCAVACEAYQLPEVKDAAKTMGFGENQSMVRTMLAIEIARQYQAGRHRLADRAVMMTTREVRPASEIGHCCP